MICFLFLLCTVAVTAQTVHPDPTVLYDKEQVHRVDIIIPADSLEWLYDSDNRWNNRHLHSTVIYSYNDQKDTLSDVGFRLRGNTSRSAAKKSFKLSFNTFVPGRKYYGVEKVNLNAQHNDPSVSRAVICSDILEKMGLYSLRSSHVEVYINDEYYGLYVNTEHIDEEYVQSRFGNNDGNLYKCTYPADLVYKGSNPSLYDDTVSEKPPYELQTNKEVRDYSDLAHFIDVLNNTPIDQFRCELEKVFDVDSYLKYIVFDVLTANWDGPIFNKNNFYLYHNTETGQFQYLPFDLDNTFGIDWFGVNWTSRNMYSWSPSSEARPLYENILADPVYRDRYSYYMSQTLEMVFGQSLLTESVSSLRDRLQPYIADDQFYSATYGFDMEDFTTSFTGVVDYNHTPIGILPYIGLRALTASSQVDDVAISPIISRGASITNYPEQVLTVTTTVLDDGAISEVLLTYTIDGLPGETTLPMIPIGDHYEATIDISSATESISYYITAVDDAGQADRMPVCDDLEVAISKSELTIAINEVQAANSNTISDEAGEYDDWVELYNYGTAAISLSGLTLTDARSQQAKWSLPDYDLAAGEYLLVWCDDDEAQGQWHTNFKLDKDGEYVGLYEQSGSIIDEVDFPTLLVDEGYARLPDGTGAFTLQMATPSRSNLSVSTIEGDSHRLSVYPSLVSDGLHIHMQTGINLEHLSIISSSGSVTTLTTPVTDNYLDVSDYPAGLYILKASDTEGRSYTTSLVKM